MPGGKGPVGTGRGVRRGRTFAPPSGRFPARATPAEVRPAGLSTSRMPSRRGRRSVARIGGADALQQAVELVCFLEPVVVLEPKLRRVPHAQEARGLSLQEAGGALEPLLCPL